MTAELDATAAPGIDPGTASADIDLAAFRANIATLSGCVGSTALMVVVKADGYGHGLLRCAAEARRAGAAWLGVATPAEVTTEDRLFNGLPKQFKVGRYHSWSVRPESVPAELEVTAVDANGQVLAFRHRRYDVRGVQFHPESILTEHGPQMLRNWLS